MPLIESLRFCVNWARKIKKESIAMYEITKSDWKIYREKLSGWQEHYMERLLQSYKELIESPGNASEHFWKLEKRIKQDRRHPEVIIEARRSTAIWDIADFVDEEVITMEELEGFSRDLIDAVKDILRKSKNL